MAQSGKLDRPGRETAASRGYDYRWQRERLDFLRRHPLCVMCAQEGSVTVATVVDHKVPHQGNQSLFWDQNNWQPLCKPHHDSHKQRQERAAGLR